MGEAQGWLAEGAAVMSPGPGLHTILARVHRDQLDDDGLVRLARARQRLISHLQAELLADLRVVGRRCDEVSPREDERRDWAQVEVACAMRWTQTAAAVHLDLADAAIDRLPGVFAALDSGDIDLPKARLICDELTNLEQDVARRVAGEVLAMAHTLTTGQLRARLRRLVLAADPAALRRRAAAQVKDRRVWARSNEDGLADLFGFDLPPQRVAAAMERLTAVARAAKSGGDDRRLDQLRADVLLDLLVGEGVAVGDPVTPFPAGEATDEVSQASQANQTDQADQANQANQADQGGQGGQGNQADVTAGPDDPTSVVGSAGVDDVDWMVGAWPEAEPEPVPDVEPDPGHDAGPEPPRFAADSEPVWAGMDVLGEPPAECEADETVDPETADLAGRFGSGDLPHSRPQPGTCPHCGHGLPASVTPAPRKGVVDLQVPLLTLAGLADFPGELAGLGPVIADVARQVATEHPEASWRFSIYDEAGQLIQNGVTRRRPTAPDEAFIKARDRTCRAPGCRVPAKYCDVDHTREWLSSRDSRRCNLSCLCRRHHRFKHLKGVDLTQLRPGVLCWTTLLGQRYVTRPEPFIFNRALVRSGPAAEDDGSHNI